jgi:hypothetical protein
MATLLSLNMDFSHLFHISNRYVRLHQLGKTCIKWKLVYNRKIMVPWDSIIPWFTVFFFNVYWPCVTPHAVQLAVLQQETTIQLYSGVKVWLAGYFFDQYKPSSGCF